MTSHDESNVMTVNTILSDHAASNWLKDALQSAMARDPIDAANDAQALAAVLDNRARGLFTE